MVHSDTYLVTFSQDRRVLGLTCSDFYTNSRYCMGAVDLRSSHQAPEIIARVHTGGTHHKVATFATSGVHKRYGVHPPGAIILNTTLQPGHNYSVSTLVNVKFADWPPSSARSRLRLNCRNYAQLLSSQDAGRTQLECGRVAAAY